VSETAWHDRALWFVRQKRDSAVKPIAEWEALRTQASQIKAHTMAHLADYLEMFEKMPYRMASLYIGRKMLPNTTAL
jgi:L-lactate dehydrogenase complex protein LldF